MSTTTTIALKEILAYSSSASELERPTEDTAPADSAAARTVAPDSVEELSPQQVDDLLETSATGRYLLDSRGLLPVPDIVREPQDAQTIYLADANDDDDDALKPARGVMVALACTALLWGLIYVIVRAL